MMSSAQFCSLNWLCKISSARPGRSRKYLEITCLEKEFIENGWTGIHGLHRRISCFHGNIINGSMHTIQIYRHTQWLVSSSTGNLCQQVLSTNCCHMHLTRPGVCILASTRRHGTETNTLHAGNSRKYRSEDCKQETLFSKDFKQMKLLSHNFMKSHLCSLWTKQNGCNHVHSRKSLDTQTHHHFSTKAAYATLKGAGMRRANQSPSTVTFDTQMYHHFSTKASYATLKGAGMRRDNHSPSSVTFDTQMYHHFSTKASYAILKGAGIRRDNQSSSGVYCRLQAYGSSASDETGDPLSAKSPQFRCYMEHLRKEHQSISETLQGGDPLSDSKQKELRESMIELGVVLDKWQELLSTEEEIAELQHLIQDSDQDKEMKELAASEKADLEDKMVDISQELIDLLMPSEETDDNDVIMEFSPGVGGQEAMLFAADMFEMYQRYATYRGWMFDVLEYYTTDMGGLRHASVSISGDQAYRLLRQEAGVHRVQRVPKTESKGRIHTSTMAVAVLPQPKEIDLKLDPKDLRIETKKASGAGGQHVNTTDSAVRITHLPTGISAESQQERSQHKNRAIAMTMLQTRIYNRILEEQASSERSLRSSQVGSGGRSEKIRTYNYQQDRVTDHRIGRSVHGVTEYLLGSDMLDQMVLTCMEGEECQNLKERILEVYDKNTSSVR